MVISDKLIICFKRLKPIIKNFKMKNSKKLGVTLMTLGTLAIILNFANRVPKVLLWIYSWGEGVAWGIKIGIVVLGAVLYFMAKQEDKREISEEV